jgi:hypothetical protein
VHPGGGYFGVLCFSLVNSQHLGAVNPSNPGRFQQLLCGATFLQKVSCRPGCPAAFMHVTSPLFLPVSDEWLQLYSEIRIRVHIFPGDEVSIIYELPHDVPPKPSGLPRCP